MNAMIELFKNHGTKILGGAQGTIALIASTTGIIPDSHLKYWLLASAILTYWRGLANTAAIAAAVNTLPPFSPQQKAKP